MIIARKGRSVVLQTGYRYIANVIVGSPFQQPKLQDEAVMNQPFARFLLEPLLTHNSTRKDTISIIDGFSGKSMTFGQVYQLTYVIAASLRHIQLSSTSACVGILSPNHNYYLPILLGISLNNIPSTTSNPLSSESELEYQLSLTNTRVLFAHEAFIDKASKVAEKLKIKVICLERKSSNPLPPHVIDFNDFIQQESFSKIDIDSFQPPSKFDSKEAVLTIPFSSGTTGRSKGVLLTHRNLIANILQTYPHHGRGLDPAVSGSQGSLLVPLPFFHIFGMVAGIFLAQYSGAKLIFLPSFDLIKYLELVQEHKVSTSYLVPPIVLALAKHPVVDKYDLSSLTFIMSGAAPLGGDVQRACSDRLKCKVFQGWGMTETSPIGALVSRDTTETVDFLKGKSGRLVAGSEGKIVDPLSGADLPSTSEGELLVRGPHVMKGYLNNPEATNEALRPDGWLHTGDIGFFDEEGYLFITDRKKELIKYKGFQVPPAELEALIISMKEVKDVVVIPVLDEEAGEIPRAYVVKHENCPESFTDKDIIDFVHERVSVAKRLRGGVRFTDSIPKSATGKLLRRVQIQIDRGEISK